MAFESEFLELMPHTITVNTRSGTNNYSEPTYSTAATSHTARVIQRSTSVRDAAGTVIEVKTIAWVASTGTFNLKDRVTLPDGSTPPIVGVEHYPDDDGNHHLKLLLGWSPS